MGFFATVAAAVLAAGASPPQKSAGSLQLWRIDCGSIDVELAPFSDTGLYAGQKRTLVASCYLIRDGDKLLLWDTGLDGALAGKPRDSEGSLLKERIGTQLRRIGVKPTDVTIVGISHYHYDHTGQVADFPGASLLIGKEDLDVIKARPELASRFAPWLAGDGKLEAVAGDKDVFGDGRVIMLAMPGHTPGHHALLVRLESGPVILSGDEYHFREQIPNRGVPSFNTDRSDTLASHDRMDRLVANLRAKLVIQHEPLDVAKLPPFPQSAR